jgi:hypothetical protein
MDTSAFACSNGVCEVGPGNVGMPFAAGLNVKLGDPLAGEAEFGYEYTMKIISALYSTSPLALCHLAGRTGGGVRPSPR